MPTLAVAIRSGLPSDDEHASLAEAREALAYWEDRAHRLPRHAVRRRREARELSARWQARVAARERDAYGRGLLGALLLVATERRLPAGVRHTGAVVARRTRQAATIVVVTVIALAMAGIVAAVELLSALVNALS
jgi:hypothetical protein